MLRIFQNQNPYTVIILFIIALILKMPMLASLPIPEPRSYHVLWELFEQKLFSIFGTNIYFYHFLAIVNICLQALFLNYIVNNFHLYSKRTYLPAYTYIVITSLLPQWSEFNLDMMNNWLFLALLNLVFSTYSDINTRKVLFNIGFVFGLLVLFNMPNVWFLFFIAFGISMLRNYKPAEWMVTLLGIFTPIYLLCGIAYLTDSFYLISKIFSTDFSVNFSLPAQQILALSVVGFFTFIGIILLSKGMNRMLFQIKKMWWVAILFLCFTVVSTLGLFQEGADVWMTALIPVSMLISKIWFVDKPKWMANIANILLLIAIIYINWFFK